MMGLLYLEDGSVYEGNGFGKVGTSVGELVFNTSMTGYEEILTDPSYAGQVINMTYPLIGNYGVNSSEKESPKVYAKGFIVKNICENPSNYRCEGSLHEMLRSMGVVGIYDVDTRSITKKIRNSGSMKCVISNDNTSIDEIKKLLKKTQLKNNFMEAVSTKEVIKIEGTGSRVALIDFGAKSNIIRNLKERKCEIIIFPYNTSYEKVMSIKPQGVLLSNGPGDPKTAIEGINLAKKLINHIPVFGICLGHQILALALGGDTYKMKFGHRGGNHGVYDKEIKKAFITSQNHGYAVAAESLKNKDVKITHINLNDNTVEGIRHSSLPVFSVQFHPEGAPGPTDASYLFDKFIRNMKNAQ